MAKRKRTVKRAARSKRARLPPITQEAVERLEKLAENLDGASKEAAAVANLARTDLAEELAKHLGEPAKKKSD